MDPTDAKDGIFLQSLVHVDHSLIFSYLQSTATTKPTHKPHCDVGLVCTVKLTALQTISTSIQQVALTVTVMLQQNLMSLSTAYNYKVSNALCTLVDK